jgi:hypothetical protein
VVQRRKKEALVWDNGTSRRGIGWTGEKMRSGRHAAPPAEK